MMESYCRQNQFSERVLDDALYGTVCLIDFKNIIMSQP